MSKKYIVRRAGNKRAVRSFKSRKAAQSFARSVRDYEAIRKHPRKVTVQVTQKKKRRRRTYLSFW